MLRYGEAGVKRELDICRQTGMRGSNQGQQRCEVPADYVALFKAV